MARLLALALAVPGVLIMSATPAQAATTCSEPDPGALVLTQTLQSTMTVAAVDNGAGLEVEVREFGSPVTCENGEGDPFLLNNLTSITLTETLGSTWILDVTQPFESAGEGSALVQVIADQGTDSILSVTSTGNEVDVWAAIDDAAQPGLDLDGDLAADVLIDNPADILNVVSGGGADVVDLSGDQANTEWPELITVQGQAGADTLTGGLTPEIFIPAEGADTVTTGSGLDSLRFESDDAADDFTGTDLADTVAILGSQGLLISNNSQPDDGDGSEGDNVGPFGVAIGNTGNDTFTSSGEDEVFVGGSGEDTVSYATASEVTSFPGTGSDHEATGTGAGFDAVHEIEVMIGSPGADSFLNDVNAMTFQPGPGDDDVSSSGAGTTLRADAVADGADTLTTTDGQGEWDYSLRTTPVVVTVDDDADDGNPLANGGAGEGDYVQDLEIVAVSGGSANDQLYGDSGDDRFSGNGGNDHVNGRGGADALLGNAGNDILLGSSGDDEMLAGNGDDTLDGGSGDDNEYGEAGSDTFLQGNSSSANGSDRLVGGCAPLVGCSDPGLDTVSYLGRSGGVTVVLDGLFGDGAPSEDDRLGADIEKVIGTNFADTLTGGGASDWFLAMGGVDTVRGGLGSDKLDGGKQADKLFGEGGNDWFYAKDSTRDTLNGGGGTDKARRDSIDVRISIEGTF